MDDNQTPAASGGPLPPKPEQQPQNNRPDGAAPKKETDHRTEAKSYAFIAGWIFADVLVVFGHNYLAVCVFYVVLVIALSLFTFHAVQGWPVKKKMLSYWAHLSFLQG
jgi:hypothetical protein